MIKTLHQQINRVMKQAKNDMHHTEEDVITKAVYRKKLYPLIAILLVLFLQTNLIHAQQKTSTRMENKELISDGFKKWASGTGNFFDLLASDMQWTITGSTPYSKTYRGKKHFMDEVINPLNARLAKKIIPSLKGLYADGDMVIALWDGEATATDGKPYNASYSWYMQMQHGKIVRVVAFLDGIEFSDIMKRIKPVI